MEYRDIDWNQLWQDEMAENRRAMPDRECVSLYQRREEAERYWRKCQPERDGRIRQVLAGLEVSPTSRVLDIGAGPGTATVPLASQVDHITAIEPAEGMADALRDHLAERSLSNVTIIRKRWEEVSLEELEPPHDVVLAAFCFGMEDLEGALAKMIAATSRWLYIYWFVGTPVWSRHRQALWPVLHATESRRSPGADVIWNLLYSMGVYADVQMCYYNYIERFASLDELVERNREGYDLRTPAQERIFRNYFADQVRREGDDLILSGSASFARIVWKKE